MSPSPAPDPSSGPPRPAGSPFPTPREGWTPVTGRRPARSSPSPPTSPRGPRRRHPPHGPTGAPPPQTTRGGSGRRPTPHSLPAVSAAKDWAQVWFGTSLPSVPKAVPVFPTSMVDGLNVAEITEAKAEARWRSVASSQLENGSSHFSVQKNRSSPVSQRLLSPSVPKEGHNPDKSLVSLHDKRTRSNTPPRLVNQRISLADYANGLDQPISHNVAAPDYVHEGTFIFPPNPVAIHAQKRNRSPPPIQLSEHLNERTSMSPLNPVGIHAPKRNRSPQRSSGHSEFVIESEREMHAKAKRLARFGAELNQHVASVKDTNQNRSPEGKPNHSPSYKRNLNGNESGETPEESVDGIPDVEEQVESSSTIITGLCQDMCPVSERGERERKGDLDHYERLDGDRNRTDRSLAVKKYNRTAEREASLIRPMLVLLRTVDYLLQLLDQPYTDKFLGLYNFLWDRMRAIRMDLRMQHLFNQEAITMLEQMIRFHIIAMHELCEYKKGEGFSEGFDAHLNIEQMNKTSVELFQMYDDHRKRGIDVPTEKEFRGYYALLKLDKHPGYKVEPAELSLDLAKMTPEIRGTPEILFARAVARACRTGNFVAFFRLAKTATYHQACLMHAHFSKLRMSALASLHSSLQNNQGIPVEQVVKWLAMEAEDVEALLEYHGFKVKEYQEAYMVKEGPFCNRDVDYPIKCSELVNRKKSSRIVKDVSSSQTISDGSPRVSVGSGDQRACPAKKTWHSDKVNQSIRQTERGSVSHMKKEFIQDATEPDMSYVTDQINYTTTGTLVVRSQTADEDMDDFDDGYPGVDDGRTHFTYSRTLTSDHINGFGYTFNQGYQNEEATALQIESLNSQTPYEDIQIISRDEDVPLDEVTSVDRDEGPRKVGRMETSTSNSEMESPTPQNKALDQKELDEQESEALRLAIREKYEAARETLKMIIRIWRQRASMKRETREQQEHLASLAMNALSLGPPFYRNAIQNTKVGDKLSMEVAIWERDERREKSWSKLNVAKLVRPILNRKNPASSYCWKLIICIQRGAAEDKSEELMCTWLSSKLMGVWNEADDGLVVPASDLSIWKDFSNVGSQTPESCCFCVVRKVLLGDTKGSAFNDITVGANAIVYLLSEALPFQIQGAHIRTLLESIPSQASLPLLVFRRYACEESPSYLISKLGLTNIDETKINTISVVSLSEEYSEQGGGFFSDDNLKGGLKWLAEQSPIMPALHLVKTRNIVLNFLGYSFQTLANMGRPEVGPGRYVAIFNEALDKSAELVTNTVNMNVNCWPCPEIDLLESRFDREVRDTLLASTSWSSPTKTEPILSAIERCKLPVLHFDLSWLSLGCRVKKEILDKKSNLEKCLYDYLTESTGLMSGDLAAEETRIMVQKGAALELHNSEYYIMPRWGVIFQRIYNWRLRSLTSKECLFAYITDGSAPQPADSFSCNDMATTYDSKAGMGIILGSHELGSRLLTSILAEPTLDELIECGCDSSYDPQPAGVPPPEIPSGSGEITRNGYLQHTGNDPNYFLGVSSDSEATDSDIGLSPKQIEATRTISVYKSDKLTWLLDQCNMLQNSIDKKLSLYF